VTDNVSIDSAFCRQGHGCLGIHNYHAGVCIFALKRLPVDDNQIKRSYVFREVTNYVAINY